MAVALVWMAAPGIISRTHQKLFSLSKEKINIAIYSYLSICKLFIFIFCVMPCLTLLVIS